MLPDILAPRLPVVFCGTAAGRRSAELGDYYAGRGNSFWKTLHDAGLTKRLFRPEEAADLPALGIGLTVLIKTAYGIDRQLPRSAVGAAARTLEDLVARWQPRIIAFNGKRPAEVALGIPSPAYGPQSLRIGGAEAWVLPSTSGAACGYFVLALAP